MARRRSAAHLYVAKVGFACELDGERIIVNKGERVREGHPILRVQEEFFEPVDTTVHYDVEQATAAPGEKRA